MKVVIVGAGVFGLSTSLALAERGHEVVVFDRLPIPAEDAASTDLNKVVRSDYGEDVLYQELGLQAIAKFKEWNKECLRKFGHILYHETGVAYFTASPDMNSFERLSIMKIKESKVDPTAGDMIEVLNFDGPEGQKKRSSVIERWPGFKDLVQVYRGGYINHRGGFADSGRTMEYLAHLARAAGVRIITGDKRGRFAGYLHEDASTPSRVTGIRTADGTEHRADLVIAAAGSWTPSIVPELSGLCWPSGQAVVHFRPRAPDQGKQCVWFGDVSKTGWYGFPGAPRDGGATFKVANHGAGYLPDPAFHRSGKVTSKQVPLRAIAEFREFLAKGFKHLAKEDMANTRLCWYCDSWDSNFYVDAVPGRPGLWVASGGSGHAFKFSPVIGDVVADLIEGKPSPFRALFGWRVPGDNSAEDRVLKDPIRDEVHFKPRDLAKEVMAQDEDLTAEAYESGKLAAKVQQLEKAKAKL
ncbi:FAD dependent oxidoreductase [Zopfochytrium polystomum]|nr:FAD dependent oxidoreductase [Zopfochytrium polystomum]